MIQYGLTQYNEINPKGNCVLIEKIQQEDLKQVDGIFIPSNRKRQNQKTGVGKILALSDIAKQKTLLSIGDYVLFDYYAAHDNQSKNILIEYENLLLQLTQDQAKEVLNGTLFN